ncbi:hypothetical protein NC997_03355 [Trichocoleus sp. DQ-A2]|uniref:hypothetical protein n=1 Tax=Cyanophyceae TaxID=3028117 RepID=UPI00168645D5|nr:hypothetical protein [Coleofasciculus sp. FACHB-501]MBD1837842.1 hypothetical protein [Coleofasciculus sp. FACHB-501]MBD1879566.1 hypothetical protein [Coleofasciculus sp. FACHB-T130]
MERSHPLQHAAQTADAIAADKALQTKRRRQSNDRLRHFVLISEDKILKSCLGFGLKSPNGNRRGSW